MSATMVRVIVCVPATTVPVDVTRNHFVPGLATYEYLAWYVGLSVLIEPLPVVATLVQVSTVRWSDVPHCLSRSARNASTPLHAAASAACARAERTAGTTFAVATTSELATRIVTSV